MFLPIAESVERFNGFGPSRLAFGLQPPGDEIVVAGDDSDVRKLLRRRCPAVPGVYGMIDAEGSLVYVGKSKSLSTRFVSYFVGDSLERKSRRIIQFTKRVVWEPATHEFTALLRELELIRRYEPRFNVRGRPGRLRRAYLGLGCGPAPYAYLTANGSRGDRLLVGPVWPGRELRRMVRVVNDCFQLRDCPKRITPAFSDQREIFARGLSPGCLRFEMGTCLGPCVAGCTSRKYAEQVRRARDFLAGADLSVLGRLERLMHAAAAAERFECAAALRDQWKDLAGLHEILQRVRTVEQSYSFVYPLPSYRGGDTWCLIRRGQVIAAARAPRGRRFAGQTLRALDQAFAPGPERLDQTTPADPDLILLVSLWFRAHPDEIQRTLAPEAARRACLEAAGPVAVR